MSSSPSLTSPGILVDDIPKDESCELLGPTALAVQGALGILVILSLVYKRHREPKKRPWKIWLFDVSKQVVGQMFVHVVNVFISDLISQYTAGNACVFYFLHILVDTTFGVAFLYFILHFLTHIFSETLHLKGFESGVYGNPPSFKYWGRQAALYVLSLTTMKLLVIILLILFPGIFDFGKWLLSWTQIVGGDSLQIIFTMGIFPIIMNVLQFWLIDSIVKASASVALEEDDTYSNDVHEPLFRASLDDDDNDSDYRPGDIESVRPHPRSHSSADRHIHNKSSTRTPLPEEHKSSIANTSQEAVDHSYPPSLTNSSSSSQSTTPKPATNLLKKTNRRPAPAPLSLRTHNPQAVNSPGVSAAQEALPHVPLVPRVAPIPGAGESTEAWADTWDDSDDWANRVGEEDWTGRRIEHKKDTLHNVWDGKPAIQIDS